MSTEGVVGQRALDEPDDLREVPIEVQFLGLIDSRRLTTQDQLETPGNA